MYKNDFPLIASNPHIHYLDSAATAQRPKAVIEGLVNYFTHSNGNAGRGSHSLAIASSLIIEETRKKVAAFIGAENPENIIFTKNCTEALNIISYCYAIPFLKEDDEILLAISNHHANLVTWQYAAKQTGAKLKFIYSDKNGNLDLEDFKTKLSPKTKIVALSSVVNATGVVNPINQIRELSHKAGAIIVVDAAQSIMHFKQNVKELDCEFLTFSGHKLFSAFGVGILYGKKELLEKMPPFLYGGDMINFVTEKDAEFKNAPYKYEGGTLDSSAIASLKFAIEYIETIGYQKIENIIRQLDAYAIDELKKLGFIEIYCADAEQRTGIIAFNVKNVHSHDTAYILNEYGVMVRSGHHCTQPLMNYLKIDSCCRASFSIFNTKEDIDVMITALKKVNSVFNER